MFYDALSRNTVRITMSEADMRRYSLKKEIVSGRTEENKRSLTRFLRRFQKESPLLCGVNSERLFLEAFLRDEGGCVLYVSTLCDSAETAVNNTAAASEICCTCESFRDLTALCTLLMQYSCPSSRLLMCGSGYCLIISCAEQDKERILRIMSEYGRVSVSAEEISSDEEQGKLLAAENAVRLIAGLA